MVEESFQGHWVMPSVSKFAHWTENKEQRLERGRMALFLTYH
jgi:hypothetical protein